MVESIYSIMMYMQEFSDGDHAYLESLFFRWLGFIGQS